VFEKSVLRRILGPYRDKVVADWRKLHNEELRNFFFSRNINGMMKSRGMRWIGHVSLMEEKRIT
jgi:hypothetical protein